MDERKMLKPDRKPKKVGKKTIFVPVQQRSDSFPQFGRTIQLCTNPTVPQCLAALPHHPADPGWIAGCPLFSLFLWFRCALMGWPIRAIDALTLVESDIYHLCGGFGLRQSAPGQVVARLSPASTFPPDASSLLWPLAWQVW